MLFWHPDELRLYQPTTYVYGIKEKEEHGWEIEVIEDSRAEDIFGEM